VLSLVVLGFKNFDVTTRACLESLKPALADPEVEVLVIDNGSPDDSGEKTKLWCAEHPRVKCLISDYNRGYAGGMNWGASCARGQWLLLVNNDTVFPSNAIASMKRVITEAPSDTAMLGPVTNAAGNGQRLWKPGADFDEWMEIGERLNRHPTGKLMPTYRCDFFCIAIRRQAWIKIGGLDLAFGLGYYEDFDFSLRLRKAGYSQYITEDVFVLHVGSATFKDSNEARVLIRKNKNLLQSKHPDAKFEHTRLGNLAVLKAYALLETTGQWTPDLEARKNLRLDALKDDSPRSFFKRMLWRWKTAGLF
jgi:GT2 family glycosyltransferase